MPYDNHFLDPTQTHSVRLKMAMTACLLMRGLECTAVLLLMALAVVVAGVHARRQVIIDLEDET
jgi:hypothetical protein